MIAVDTNILLYAHRADSRGTKRRRVPGVSGESRSPWAFHGLRHEFLAIATIAHLRSSINVADAIEQVECWREHRLVTLVRQRFMAPAARTGWSEARSGAARPRRTHCAICLSTV